MKTRQCWTKGEEAGAYTNVSLVSSQAGPYRPLEMKTYEQLTGLLNQF